MNFMLYYYFYSEKNKVFTKNKKIGRLSFNA